MRHSLIDDIKDQITVRELAEEAGAIFNRDSAACPLHGGDNRTAFHLRENDRYWHCFTRCPDGKNDGDVIDFYERWKNVDTATAIKELARRCNIALDEVGPQVQQRTSRPAEPDPPPLVSEHRQASPATSWQERARSFVTWSQQQLVGSEGQEYLAKRGINANTARTWGLGWNPQWWKIPAADWGLTGDPVWLHPGVVIPHEDLDGQIWGIKIRVFKDGEAVTESGGKYRGPRGSKGRGMLYGEKELRRAPVLLLTEGEFDAVLAWQEAGDLCDVATLAGARKRMHPMAMATMLQYAATLAVLDDDDAADEGRAYLREIPRVRPVNPPDHDLTDYLVNGGNLRSWIAGQVRDQMVRLLDGLNDKCHPDLFEYWLGWYTRAEDAR
jgi:DNA primase